MDGRVTYALQVDKVVTTARDMKRSFAAGRLAQLPIVAGASALVGLLMPRVTYGAGVWSGGVVPKEAQKALDGTMHMMLHTSYLPKEAAHALTGVPSLQHTYVLEVPTGPCRHLAAYLVSLLKIPTQQRSPHTPAP